MKIWETEYKSACKKECNDETRRAARYILQRNIVCGNALSLRCVDDQQQDTPEPIVFSEWSFPQNNAFIHRKDYTFAELLDDKPQEKKDTQQTLFDAKDPGPDGEGRFVQEFVCHYRRLGEEAEPQQIELTM